MCTYVKIIVRSAASCYYIAVALVECFLYPPPQIIMHVNCSNIGLKHSRTQSMLMAIDCNRGVICHHHCEDYDVHYFRRCDAV
jgi:hypothetical protein